MKDLDCLSQEFRQLVEEFKRRLRVVDDGPMTQVLKELSARNDSASIPQDRVEGVLRRAKQGKSADTPTDIIYLCFGLCTPLDSDSWILIENTVAFEKVITAVRAVGVNPSILKRCYQGLLLSYFLYPGVGPTGSDAGRKNWESIRALLEGTLDKVSAAKPISTWLEVLKEHKNLLSKDPCNRYGAALLNGSGSEFKEVCTALGVPDKSWVWEAAILAQVGALEERADDGFKKGLDGILTLFGGSTNISIPESVVIRGLAKVIIRYSKCDNKEVHEKLRDMAVSKIGNPWLHRAAWQGYVANEQARELVNGWLKRRLITDFFGILSEDRAADSRRLKFWMRFEPLMTDLWIALGPSAMNERGSNYQELKKRAQGRLLHLDGPANQNAFIMKIGKFYVVEFGEVGRCFFYEETELPFSLDAKRVYEGYQKGGLKSRNAGYRIAHWHSWEENFENWLCPKLNWRPESTQKRKHGQAAETTFHTATAQMATSRSARPMKDWTEAERVEFYQHIGKYKLECRDNRSAGGAIWVLYMSGGNSPETEPLRRWGFQYKLNRGWWKE